MNRYVFVVAALAACKGGAASSGAGSAAAKPAAAHAAAADPWAQKAAPVAVDPNDPSLARAVELAQRGPGTLQFPDADAVIALDRDDITLARDGSVVHHHHSLVKLLDAQRAKEKFADVHIPYDTKRQTLELVRARTVNADGAPHAAAGDEIGDIVPPYLADATTYADVRERVVSFPAVDKGSVVELEYTRTTKAGPDAPLGGEELLGAWSPVIERVVTLTAPAGITPKFAVEGAEVRPVETAVAAGHTWTFTRKDLPDAHPESGSPSDALVLPRLVYGFQPNWDKVTGPISDRFVRAAVPTPLPASVVAEAARIVSDAQATTETDKAAALFAFVAHDIRSVELPFGDAGYEPHAPDAVLAARYADPRDKVGLLLALAAAQGLSGRAVLARSGKVPVIASVPTVAQFDRVIARVVADGKEVWLDPADEHAPFGVAFAGQDNLVLPLVKDGGELGARPALAPSTSTSHTTATLALSPTGDLTAKYHYDLTGWYADQASRELRALKGEPRDQFFQRAAIAVSVAAVDTGHTTSDLLAVRGPVTVDQALSAPGYAPAQGSVRVVELPAVSLGLAEDAPSASLTTRKYPLWVGVPRTEQTDVTLAVPAGWTVAYAPPPLTGTADGVTFTSTCETKDQTITCHDELKLDKLVLQPAQYAAFRAAITKLAAYDRRIVVLQKGTV